MAEEVPYGRKTQQAPSIAEIDVLWITAGLGCDGDTIAMTAATQPSIEDIVLGTMPWIPKVHFHNPRNQPPHARRSPGVRSVSRHCVSLFQSFSQRDQPRPVLGGVAGRTVAARD